MNNIGLGNPVDPEECKYMPLSESFDVKSGENGVKIEKLKKKIAESAGGWC